MHNLLMNVGPNRVDHIDRNGLNNRTNNLRVVTRSQNQQNRKFPRNFAGHRGVTWNGKAWEARITVRWRVIRLGRFARKRDAIAARTAAETRHFV